MGSCFSDSNLEWCANMFLTILLRPKGYFSLTWHFLFHGSKEKKPTLQLISILTTLAIVGGWTNPSEKYASSNREENFPKFRSENEQKKSFELPLPPKIGIFSSTQARGPFFARTETPSSVRKNISVCITGVATFSQPCWNPPPALRETEGI